MNGDDRAANGPTGLVVAWRRWRLRPDGSGRLLLGSAHEDYVWRTPTLTAECDPARTWSFRLALDEEEHYPPAEGCRCGVYAYRTPELARPMGPGVWVHGQVLVGGPMFLTDNGYRGRQATIAGPLALAVECVGGDDLYSPTRCFGAPEAAKYDGRNYYPVCSIHHHAPMHRPTLGVFTMAEFVDAASGLAVSLGTAIGVPASL